MEHSKSVENILRVRRFLISAFLCVGALDACSAVGTQSIDWGRTPYNQAIHSTAEQQTLLNIIRVSHDETPFFMDVSEVDEATTVGASIIGGPSNIGATPNLKSTSAGTIEGSWGTAVEAPTVRYLPLLWQPLIAQVSTPLTVDALTNLYDSDWPLDALLTLGVDRLTPGYQDYATALNAIVDLDLYGAIIIAGTKGDRGRHDPDPGSIVINEPQSKNDTLTIYYEPNRILTKRAECDGSNRAHAKEITDALWARLNETFGVTKPTTVLEISAAPRSAQAKSPKAPTLRLRSALGIMRKATGEGLGAAQIEVFDSSEKITQLVQERAKRDWTVDTIV